MGLRLGISFKGLWIIGLVIACLGLESCSFMPTRRDRSKVKVTRVDQPTSKKTNSLWKKLKGKRKPQSVANRSVWSRRNAQVKKYLKVYGSKSNRTVELALKRGQKYLPYIKRELKKRKMPMELAFLPMLESSFDPEAESRTGALGMWQFTSATAKDYGLEKGWLSDERLDWKKSTKAAVIYLQKLGKRYNNNWELALAAYNGGPGYISRSMKKQGTQSFWKLKIREEPKTYVPKFIAMIQVAKRKYPRLYKA